MEAPCKDCQDRCIGCHAVCGRYIKFDAENKERLKQHAAEHALDGYRADMVKAARRKQRKFRREYKND